MVKEAGKLTAGVEFEHLIYEASPNRLRQVIAELDDAFHSAMIVGHNPGMEGFIRYLTGSVESMPTAALAVIDLDISKWHEINDGCGTLQKIFRPKDEMS